MYTLYIYIYTCIYRCTSYRICDVYFLIICKCVDSSRSTIIRAYVHVIYIYIYTHMHLCIYDIFLYPTKNLQNRQVGLKGIVWCILNLGMLLKPHVPIHLSATSWELVLVPRR